MVVSYETLTMEYDKQYHNELRHGLIDAKLLSAMKVQSALNESMLELLENILSPNYPGATRYRSS